MPVRKGGQVGRRLLTLLLCTLLSAAGTVPAGAAPGAAVPERDLGPTAPPADTRTRALPTGDYGWPLAGAPRVGRAFDPPQSTYGSGHRGVDLVASPGTAVLSAGGGTVVFAGSLAGRGVVSVEHADGLRTTYEPVTASVAVGAHVARGDILGVLEPGHPQCPAAACLHWGVRRGADGYLDPLRLLGRWEVRLLPWVE